MADPNAKLDPVVQKALKDYAEAKLGLIGALRLKGKIENCPCDLCQLIRVAEASS
jgi:hypothetical protein